MNRKHLIKVAMATAGASYCMAQGPLGQFTDNVSRDRDAALWDPGATPAGP